MDGPQEVSTYRQVHWRRYATAKLSTEYDSEGSVFVNKFSSRIFNGPEKITGSFQREASGDLRYPLLGVVTKYLSVIHDPEDKNALVTLKADVGQNLQVKYLQDVKAQQGDLKIEAHTSSLKYRVAITSDIPTATSPKVVCTFPIGELRAEVEKDEERAIALSGFFGGSLLNDQVVASYTDENATLKYTFRDLFGRFVECRNYCAPVII